MSNLDENTRLAIITIVKKAIIDMIDSYLNIDGCNLDIKEFGTLKKAFDSVCNNQPFDNEARVYLKTLAGDKIYEGLNSLMEQTGDNPKLKSAVNDLIIWYHIARDI